VLTGSPAERDRLAQAWPPAQRPGGVVDASGRLDTAQLSVLLHRASAVAACSTGPLHLAAALGTPALGLYAPRKGVALDRWAPLGQAAVGVQAYHRCPHGRHCSSAACPCMAALEPRRVASALHRGSRPALNIEPLAPYVLAAPAAEPSRREIDGAALPGGPI
jgi:ADP-heptose:LPS heptosyltransferase